MPTLGDGLDKLRQAGQGGGMGIGGRGGGGGMMGGMMGGGGGGLLGGAGLQQRFAMHAMTRMGQDGLSRVSPYMIPQLKAAEGAYEQQRNVHNARVDQLDGLRETAFGKYLAATGQDAHAMDEKALAGERQKFLYDGVEVRGADGRMQISAYDDRLRDHVRNAEIKRDNYASDQDYAAATAQFNSGWGDYHHQMPEYAHEHRHLVKRGGSYYMEAPKRELEAAAAAAKQARTEINGAPDWDAGPAAAAAAAASNPPGPGAMPFNGPSPAAPTPPPTRSGVTARPTWSSRSSGSQRSTRRCSTTPRAPGGPARTRARTPTPGWLSCSARTAPGRGTSPPTLSTTSSCTSSRPPAR